MSKNRKRTGPKRGNARSGRRRASGRQKVNVRVTSKRASRARMGLLSRRWFKFGAAALLTLGLGYGLWRAADHLLFESPKFRLSVIDYQTDGYLSKGRILEEARVEPGVNLLRVDLDDARQRILAGLPWVREVEIVRDLPDRIAFKVEERHPVAWLGNSDRLLEPQKRRGGLLLDRDAVIVPCERLERRFIPLPVVFTDDYSDAIPGQPLESKTSLKAVELVIAAGHAFRGSPVELETVRPASDYSLAGRLNTGSEVVFGLVDFDRQMNDLRVLLAEATRRGRALATANLLVKKNIPVRFSSGAIDDQAAVAAPRAIAVNPLDEPATGATQRRRVLRSLPTAPAGEGDPVVRSILRVD